MAEILGVLAAGSQLAQYALQISAAVSEIHDRVRDGTELRKHIVQIQQLIDTTIEIQRNPLAYNASVLRHLTIATDEAKSLLELLQRLSAEYTHGSLSKRYYKAARGARDEKRIAMSLKRLEQEKTSLLFCIGIGNTEQLHAIQSGVKSLTGDTCDFGTGEVALMPEPKQRATEVIAVICTQGHHALISRANQCAPCCPHCGSHVARVSEASQQGGFPTSNDPQSKVESTYEGCKIVGPVVGAKQMNGHLGNNVVGIYHYKDCTVDGGNGFQMNGSASGEHGMAIASSFFVGSDAKMSNSKG